MAIRVVVAEDNYLVREAVTGCSSRNPTSRSQVCARTSTGSSPTVEETEPDVVVTDIRMPPTGTDEGCAAAAQLRESHPRVSVVVLSQYVEPGYALELLEGGSTGRAYLLKERVSDVDQLAARHPRGCGGRIGDRPQSGGSARPSPFAPRRLPTRPLDALARAKCSRRWPRGGTMPAVAGALGLSERAVEKHINSVFAKLGLSEEPDVHRRVKAVLLYLADR